MYQTIFKGPAVPLSKLWLVPKIDQHAKVRLSKSMIHSERTLQFLVNFSMAQSFKTLIFLTIPLNVFILVLVCTSLATQSWVTGIAERNDSSIEFNFGLFSGQKSLRRSGVFSNTLKSELKKAT